MIGKGQSIAHTGASMQYGWNQEKEAEIVYKQHLCGENPKEITKEFQVVQQTNNRCKKNTLSFVISPTVEDGKTLRKKELARITEKFMENMRLKERQAIAFVHRDKQHLHIHLYVNRIDFKGQTYNDSFIGKRSQQAAEKTAQELGLTTVKEVQQQKEQSLKHIRDQIRQIHEKVMHNERPKEFDQYIKQMQKHKVKVIPSINKSNQLQGFRFEYKTHNLKGSEVHRSMTGSKLTLAISNHNHRGLKMVKDNSIKLLGKTILLSPNIATKLAEKALKQLVKKAIDTGIGY